MPRLFVISVLALTAVSTAWAAESKQTKIQRALSAAPGFIKATATVAAFEQGKMVVLRPGTNGFTCIPGTPGRGRPDVHGRAGAGVGAITRCAQAEAGEYRARRHLHAGRRYGL